MYTIHNKERELTLNELKSPFSNNKHSMLIPGTIGTTGVSASTTGNTDSGGSVFFDSDAFLNTTTTTLSNASASVDAKMSLYTFMSDETSDDFNKLCSKDFFATLPLPALPVTTTVSSNSPMIEINNNIGLMSSSGSSNNISGTNANVMTTSPSAKMLFDRTFMASSTSLNGSIGGVGGGGLVPLGSPTTNTVSMSGSVKESPRQKESKKGQGYRKLWKKVSSVGVGENLGSIGGDNVISDTTVEDLLRVISEIPHNKSVISYVSNGLTYLDSSACAALFKELYRQGMSNRAIEIFDWMRTLDSSHELASLCDVYTYTTMISQCGTHQQLRRSLELVAEMRSRGIKCNVRTFTALMNVCIKANEMDLALDVYGQMIREGCTANLVTYNTLIDIYGKTGQWAKAIEVLDTLDLQNIQAEVRTYNTVISACNRSGEPEKAFEVYQRMLAKNMKPSATTYTALISAYGKKGQVDQAFEIFQDMVRRGCERNVITYSSLIGACEKAGCWKLAIELFNNMHLENCKPNVVTYNSLIAACANGFNWIKACEVFDNMIGHNIQPDNTTYSAVLSALMKQGPWLKALFIYEGMNFHGCRPDLVIYNALIDIFWQSGSALAQARAIQLWQLAVQKGIIRFNILSNTDVEYSVIVFTCGAAMISVLRWLLDLNKRVESEGFGFLQRSVSLLLQRGKHNIVEHTLEEVCEMIKAVLASGNSPFSVSINEQSVNISADSNAVVNWMYTNDFKRIVSLAGDIDKNMNFILNSSHMTYNEESALETRCVGAFAAVKEFETVKKFDSKVFSPGLLAAREDIVALAISKGTLLNLKDEIVQDALRLFDRVLCAWPMVDIGKTEIILTTCLYIISNICEVKDNPFINLAAFAEKSGFDEHVLSMMESNIKISLNMDVGAISPLRIFNLLIERLNGCFNSAWYTTALANEAQNLIRKISGSAIFLDFQPSTIAISLMYALRQFHGIFPFWPVSLTVLTDSNPTFDMHCVSLIHKLILDSRSTTNSIKRVDSSESKNNNSSSSNSGMSKLNPQAPAFYFGKASSVTASCISFKNNSEQNNSSVSQSCCSEEEEVIDENLHMVLG